MGKCDEGRTWLVEDVPWMTAGYCSFQDKDNRIRELSGYQLSRTLRMFEWKGLPPEVTPFTLEAMFQCGRHLIGTYVGDEMAVYNGVRRGFRDRYYIPQDYQVTNPHDPAIKPSRLFHPGKDCVFGKNDSMAMGMQAMNDRYSTLMVENELSMYLVTVLLRAQAMITAADDNDKASADDFIKALVDGDFKTVLSRGFLEGIKGQPLFSGTGMVGLQQLIEHEQYLKASWDNEQGLDANYNMKRESLSMVESQMGSQALRSFPDDMLMCRREWADGMNEMYADRGLHLEVNFAGGWKESIDDPEDVKEPSERPEQPTPGQDPDREQPPEESDEEEKEDPKDEPTD